MRRWKSAADYMDARRSRSGVDPTCTVLTEHGISIAPSTYYKAKARGRVSAAELADAYAPTPCTRCMWPVGGSTVSAKSDTP